MPFSKQLSRAASFFLRHRWSLSLTLASAAFFVELALELNDGRLHAFDAKASLLVARLRGHADGLMLSLSFLGSGYTLTVIVAGVTALLLVAGRRRPATFVLVASAGCFLLNTTLKLSFARLRPQSEQLYLIPTPDSFSFPSGHAMGSMGVLLTLIVLAFALRLPLRLLMAALGGCLIVGVAISRVYFGVHFPSDVLGGLLAGGAWVSATTGWFYPRLLPGEAAIEPA